MIKLFKDPHRVLQKQTILVNFLLIQDTRFLPLCIQSYKSLITRGFPVSRYHCEQYALKQSWTSLNSTMY